MFGSPRLTCGALIGALTGLAAIRWGLVFLAMMWSYSLLLIRKLIPVPILLRLGLHLLLLLILLLLLVCRKIGR